MKIIMLTLTLAFSVMAAQEDFSSKNAYLEKLLKKRGFSKNGLSFHVIDLDSGKTVASFNEERLMILGSVSKLFSMYYYLSILGPQFTFKTKLTLKEDTKKEDAKKDDIKNGVIRGDLFLQGGGDPYLSAAHLMSMALALKEKGVSKIDGRFIYDQKALPFTTRLSPIGQQDQPDNPSLGALNAEFNRFTALKSGKTIPQLSHLKLKRAKNSWDPGLKFKNSSTEPGKEQVWLRAKDAHVKAREDLPARNAGLFAANYFRYMCSLLNIELPFPQEGAAPSKTKDLYVHESLPLIRLASLAMEYSNNLFAELPTLMASKRLSGSKLGIKESAFQMKSWLEESFSKIDFKKSNFLNGSGLGVGNQASAKALAQFLYAARHGQFEGRRFWSLLSANGHSGWLVNRLSNPEAVFRIWAKTGSLFYVNNIAGYFINSKGKMMAFSLLLTDIKKREFLNPANKNPDGAKADKLRKEARQWSRSSRKLLDEILIKWLQT